MTVTKQQQLEWLAKEFSEWPGFAGVGIRMSNLVIGEHGCEHIITREEWQQERDKMQKQGEKADSWHERGENPPVGATVEKKCKSATIWTEIKIVAAGNQLVIFGYPAGDESVGEWSDYEFRPIRTEREKAIDEMIAAIDHIKEGNFQTFIGALYDAGYRKVKP